MLTVLLLSWILVGGIDPIKTESISDSCPMSNSRVPCRAITKNGQTIQLIYKLFTLDVMKRISQLSNINATWKCTEPACLSTPCQYEGNCTEVDDGFKCECPKGFGGNRCEIYPPRNCAELKARDGITENGTYVIDPDGKRTLSFPVEMECLMADGVTSVPHDITGQEMTPFELGVGQFVRNVTYPFDSNTILALIQNSKSCKQYIFATTYKSYIYSSDGITQNVWWVSRQGRKMPNWGDSPSDHSGCACSYTTPSQPLNTCSGNGRCNSDYSMNPIGSETSHQDTGYLTDMSRLPVIRLHTGYTTIQHAPPTRIVEYNLGPLLCEGYWF